MKEVNRYQWEELRAMGSAAHIPEALRMLATASTREEADTAYWNIDNTVIVQGNLYEAAVPTLICALGVLQGCTPVARPRVLELLEIIGAGEPDPSEIIAGNANIRHECLRELCYGIAVYFEILEHGDWEEIMWCIDILMMCTEIDKAITPRLTWWLQNIIIKDIEEHHRLMIANYLESLQ